jgi:hypothetical protein
MVSNFILQTKFRELSRTQTEFGYEFGPQLIENRFGLTPMRRVGIGAPVLLCRMIIGRMIQNYSVNKK